MFKKYEYIEDSLYVDEKLNLSIIHKVKEDI